MPRKVSFASRLKALRKESGMSQAKLAERAGIAISTLRHFEYGLREPTFATLEKLAAGLGVSLSAFESGKPRRVPTERKPPL